MASFTSLNILLIFHFKHVFREAGRKVLMEPVFSMDRGLAAQLCLGSPPIAYEFNTVLVYKFRYSSNLNDPIHYGKSCVRHYTIGVAGGNAYDF